MLLNNGDGTFAAPENYAVGSRPWAIVAGDVDGDGDIDLAVANSGSNSVSILLNNGDGTYATAVHYDVGGWPNSIAAIDMDLDGDMDLVTANFDDHTISVLQYIGPVAPAVPTILAASPGNGQVGLTWTANSEGDFLGYMIYGGTSPNPTIVIDSTNAIMDTSVTIDGLSNNITYYYRVTAKDILNNESEYSNELVATLLDLTPPSIPSGLSAEPKNGEVRLYWNPNNETDFGKYLVYDATSIIDSTMSILDTTITISDLTNGTEYNFRITASDASGHESGFSNEVTVIPQVLDIYESTQIPTEFALYQNLISDIMNSLLATIKIPVL